MFFNYDLFEIVAIAFVVSGILTFSFYNSSGTINNESLINTNSTVSLSNLDSNVQLDNLPSQGYVNAAVQTETTSLWQSFKDLLRDVFSINS